MRIGIVGAGIGGLAAAAFLQRDGHDVVVFESSHGSAEVGAGIQISPNGSRLLADLGLGPAMQERFVTPDRLVLRRWQDDTELLATSLGNDAQARWGAPYYNAYRPDVISALLSVVDVDIVYDAKVTELREDEGSATLSFADGKSRQFDIVIGADGIHSTVRRHLFGDFPSRFSGMVAYRALVRRESVGHLPVEATNRVGPGGHVVTYFVGEDCRFLNVVAIVNQTSWTGESWTEEGDKEEMQSYFSGWSPECVDILRKVETPVYRWALHDRTPLPTWSTNRCTLLGDACHPMVPLMAQGACQALEDAAVLARALDQLDPTDALRAYEQIRLPRTSRFQELSFANATTYHLPDGEEQAARDALYRLAAASAEPLAVFDWIYSHDARLELTGERNE